VVRGQELPTAYVRAKFEDRSFFRLRNIEGSQNFEIGSPAPGDAQFRANLGPGQELPTAYVHVKFEDRSFTRLRNIEGVPKFIMPPPPPTGRGHNKVFMC